jgi:hypothetical protein
MRRVLRECTGGFLHFSEFITQEFGRTAAAIRDINGAACPRLIRARA